MSFSIKPINVKPAPVVKKDAVIEAVLNSDGQESNLEYMNRVLNKAKETTVPKMSHPSGSSADGIAIRQTNSNNNWDQF